MAGRSRPVRPISPNAASPLAHRDAARGRGDRERDPEIGARLVDPHAPGDVDEHVGAAERQPGVAGEHGDDHREPLRVDAGGDPARHREVGRRDERLDLEQERPRSLERARDGGADLARLAAAEERRGVGDADEARRRSSRRRRARSSSRSGSSPPAGRGGRGSGRPRTGARSRRDARARAGRRPSRPSSRGPTRKVATPASFATRSEPRRRLAHLRDRARRRADLGRVERLHRVDHADGGTLALESRADRVELRLGEDLDRARSRRAASARSLTCATDSSPVTSSARRVGRHRAERRQEQGRLADAGLAADEHERGGHEARRRARGRARRRRSRSGRPPRPSRRRGAAAGALALPRRPAPAAPPRPCVPNAPQPGQRPSQRPDIVPHSVQACWTAAGLVLPSAGHCTPSPRRQLCRFRDNPYPTAVPAARRQRASRSPRSPSARG